MLVSTIHILKLYLLSKLISYISRRPATQQGCYIYLVPEADVAVVVVIYILENTHTD